MTKSPWGKDRIRGAAVAFEELSYTYAGGVNALQSVSIRVAASDFTAIMGANGSGNSTLMKLAIGLLHPSQGEVQGLGATAIHVRPDRLTGGRRQREQAKDGRRRGKPAREETDSLPPPIPGAPR